MMRGMSASLTAYLAGGTGHGRTVDLPLDSYPQLLDFVTGAGTVPYQRVGYTAEYRPCTVLDKLAPSNGVTPPATPAATAPAARKASPRPRRQAPPKAEFQG